MISEKKPPHKKIPAETNHTNGKQSIHEPSDDDIIYSTAFETPQSKDVDAKSIEKELNQLIKGEVRFDDGTKALYATDGSNYRQIPIGVVLPKSEEDIINTLAICRKYHAPVLSRGGGTSLAGQCCNVAVVMDMSKYYNKILNIEKEKKLVTVQPGIVLDEMRNTTEKKVSLTFGPDPATQPLHAGRYAG